MHNKGQTATEYLIILAVVIVIAIIVVGVIGGIPSIGGGAQRNTGTSYWRTAQIGVTPISIGAANNNAGQDFYYNGSGHITVRNNMVTAITITEVIMTDVSSKHSDTNSSISVISSGQSREYHFSNLSNSGNPGESYSYEVEIKYTDSSTGARYSFKGDGNFLSGNIRTN